MSTNDWEALPQRRTRRRPPAGNISASTKHPPQGDHLTDPGNGDAHSETTKPEDIAGGVNERIYGPEGAELAVARQAEEDSLGEPNQPQNVGGEEEKGEGVVCSGEADAAVGMAIESRARMARFSGGLGGGAGVDGENFEYLDHTADVQLHSWGDSMERAMEAALAAMFNVMTDIGTVEIDLSLTRDVEAKGHDSLSLLFSLLDEFLFLFHSEGFAVKQATIVGEIDRGTWRARAKAEGETFDLSKHPQGTEVKAITYSNMQINEDASGHTDIYVIVDI